MTLAYEMGKQVLGHPFQASTKSINRSLSLNLSSITQGAFHQRRSSLNQVQTWPWPRFSSNFCCTNAVQIKSRVKLGLTLNRRRRWIKLWSSVQLALLVTIWN